MKKLILGVSLLVSAALSSQVTVQIGTGVTSATGQNYNPIYRSSAGSSFDFHRAYFLYTAAELAAAGVPAGATITKIEWDKSNNGATIATTSNIFYTILMKNSSASTYAAAQTWGTLSTGATTVYTNANEVIPATIGWLPYNLSPFVYNGASLEILTDWDISQVAGNPTTAGFSYNTTAIAGRVGGNSNSTALNATTSMATLGNRPNIKITFTPPPACSGTPNGGNAVASFTSICTSQSVSLNLSGSTVASGLTYQWYSSPDGISWTAIPSATNMLASATVTATTHYQAVVSCGANTATSVPVVVNFGLTQNAGSATASSTMVCPNAPVTFSLSGSSSAPGMTYQWYSSPNGVSYTAVSNATLISTTQSVTSNIYYQNVLTCGTSTSASSPIQIMTQGTTTNTVPYFESFEGITANNQLPNCSWAASNLPTICKTYTAATGSYNQFASTGTKFASFRWSTAAAGDYFYSNGIQLTAGTTYSASVKYIADGASGWLEFGMLVGPNQSTVGLTSLASVNNITNTTYSTLANTFSVASSGIYYMAIKAIGNGTPWYLSWDDLSVTLAPVDDAGAQALVSPVAVGCYSSSEPVSVTIKNFGSNSISNVPVTVTVTGAGSAVLTGTYTGVIPPTGTVNFVVGNLNMSAAGVYSFNAQTSFAGDTGPSNNSMPMVTRTVVAALPLAYSQDFNASTALPAGFTSTNYFVMSNHGAGYNNNALSYNLYSTSSTVAIVTLPKFTGVNANSTLTYDYRIQDWSGYPSSGATSLANWANDSLNVYVSTNCGLSYTLVQSNNANNHTPTTAMTTKTVNLAPYTGSDIIIRFIAKKAPAGTGDYFADLDNINVTAPLNDDVAATALTSPGMIGCYSASEPVNVTIKNMGLLPQSNIPVTVTVTGAANQTLNTTFAGPLAPGATVTVPVGVLNMSAVGVYTFNASTSLTGDMQPLNDAMPVATRTVVGALPVPFFEDFNAVVGNVVPAGWEADNDFYDFKVTNSPAEHGTGGSRGLTTNVYGGNPSSYANMPKIGPVTANTKIKFDYRIVNYSSYANPGGTATAYGTTDSLLIRVSTDCGLTFSTTAFITGSNHTVANTFTTTQAYSLGAFAGSDVIVRFEAKWGTGDYYVDIDNINLCNAPVAPATTATTICEGGSASLTAAAGTGTVQWYATSTPTNAIGNGTVYATPSLSVNTTYYVSEMNSCAESTLTPVLVTVNPNPVVTASATNGTICAGGSTALNAGGATSYTWSTGSNNQIIAVTPSVTTTYTVDGESLGCVASQTVEVFVNALPSVSLNAASLNGCVNGNTIALTGSPAGGVYTGTNVTNGVFTPGAVAGTFMPAYNVTDAVTGCSNSASVTIVVNTAPGVSLTAATTTACTNGPTISLTGSPSGGVYSGTGVSNGVFTPPATQGTYTAVYSYTDAVTGCDANTNTSIVVSVCTDISKLNSGLNGLSVYPNPNTGMFTVELSNGSEKNIVITDLTGRVLLTEVTSDDKAIINLNGFTNGVYFVKIMSNNSVETVRVIKQ